jgi:hypothetical protein
MLKGKIDQSKNLFGSIPGNNLFNHEYLLNRDANGSHPITAIEGLTEQLTDLKRHDSLLDMQIESTKNKIKTSITDVEQSIEDEADRLGTRIDGVILDAEETKKSFNTAIKDLDDQLRKQLALDKKVLSSSISTLENETDEQISELVGDLANVTDDLQRRWLLPDSLIFNSKEDAEKYVRESSYVYPGQLITVNTAGLFEAFILDNEKNLQLFSGGGGGGGAPDRVTETQYCIQITTDAIPSTMDDFVTDTANSIAIPNPKRKNNTITTKQLDNPGGYVYYVSQLADLKFTSAGFDAGFTIVGKVSNADSYNIYRSNQKLMAPVTITIN